MKKIVSLFMLLMFVMSACSKIGDGGQDNLGGKLEVGTGDCPGFGWWK